MERIKTRIIIAIAERLSAAKDSDAKTELIEELSENIYQRYVEQVNDGVEHEEAYQRAMEDLGDVSELLEYLEDREYSEAEDESHRTRDHVSDFLEGIDDVVRETVSQTKDAVKYATAMARDLGEKAQKKCSDVNFSCGYNKERGFFWENNKNDESENATPIAGESIPAEQVNSLDILLGNGKVDVSVAEQDTVTVGGSGEELDVRLNEDGVLFIRQGKTASSAVMHERGMTRTDVTLVLPVKVWESIQIETKCESVDTKFVKRKFFHIEGIVVNGTKTDLGNVTFHNALEARQFSVKTNVGDIRINGLSCHTGELSSTSGDMTLKHIKSTEKLTVRTVGGDISTEDIVCPTVSFNSTSGDMELNHIQCTEKLSVQTVGGDISTEDIVCPTVSFKSTSGDMKLNHIQCTEKLSVQTIGGDITTEDIVCPTVSFSSTSGDVELNHIQCTEKLSVQTIGGDISTENVICPTQSFKSTSGDITLDGKMENIEVASISGDITIGDTFLNAKLKSTSGDVNAASSILPQELNVSSMSGDCTVKIPNGEGFSVRLRSTTGNWKSAFALVRDNSGNAIYLDGGDRNFSITSVSGDVSLEKY